MIEISAVNRARFRQRQSANHRVIASTDFYLHIHAAARHLTPAGYLAFSQQSTRPWLRPQQGYENIAAMHQNHHPK